MNGSGKGFSVFRLEFSKTPISIFFFFHLGTTLKGHIKELESASGVAFVNDWKRQRSWRLLRKQVFNLHPTPARRLWMQEIENDPDFLRPHCLTAPCRWLVSYQQKLTRIVEKLHDVGVEPLILPWTYVRMQSLFLATLRSVSEKWFRLRKTEIGYALPGFNWAFLEVVCSKGCLCSSMYSVLGSRKWCKKLSWVISIEREDIIAWVSSGCSLEGRGRRSHKPNKHVLLKRNIGNCQLSFQKKKKKKKLSTSYKISDKNEKLVRSRDVSPSQGLLQSTSYNFNYTNKKAQMEVHSCKQNAVAWSLNGSNQTFYWIVKLTVFWSGTMSFLKVRMPVSIPSRVFRTMKRKQTRRCLDSEWERLLGA